MTQPIIFVVIDEEEPLRSFERDLSRRFGRDYLVLAEASPEAALRQLEELQQDAIEVPNVIADLWLP